MGENSRQTFKISSGLVTTTVTIPSSMESFEKTMKVLEQRFRKIKIEKKGNMEHEKIVGHGDVLEIIFNAFRNRLETPPDLQYQSILLAGVPGTAKKQTLLYAAVLASKCLNETISVFPIRLGHLLLKYSGANNARALFKVAAQCVPALIIIDEADEFLRQWGNEGGDFFMTFGRVLLMEMESNKGNGVLVAWSTSLPGKIDRMLWGKFDETFLFYPPTPEERLGILNKFLDVHSQTHVVGEIDKNYVVEHTKGFTGFDIGRLVGAAAYKSARYCVGTRLFDIRDLTKFVRSTACVEEPVKTVYLPLSNEMFKAGLLEVGSTCKDEDIRRVKDFELKRFGGPRERAEKEMSRNRKTTSVELSCCCF